MRHILVEITCRGCAYHTHVKSHTLVKPQLEPILKERILQGTMFTYESQQRFLYPQLFIP